MPVLDWIGHKMGLCYDPWVYSTPSFVSRAERGLWREAARLCKAEPWRVKVERDLYRGGGVVRDLLHRSERATPAARANLEALAKFAQIIYERQRAMDRSAWKQAQEKGVQPIEISDDIITLEVEEHRP